MNKQTLIDYLRDKGVSRVELDFSGGNDEGGVDNVAFFDADGTRMESPIPPSVWVAEVGRGVYGAKDERGKPYPNGTRLIYAPGAEWPVRYRLATEDEIHAADLHTALNAPIYDRYGSFAGEFNVSGTLTWDVTQGKAFIRGEESVQNYVPFEDEV